MVDKPTSSHQSDIYEDKGTWNNIQDVLRTFSRLSTNIPGNDEFFKDFTTDKHQGADHDKKTCSFSGGGRGRLIKEMKARPDWDLRDSKLHSEIKKVTGLDHFESEQFLKDSTSSSDSVPSQETGIFSACDNEEEYELEVTTGASDLVKDLSKSQVSRLPVLEQKPTRKTVRVRNAIILNLQNQKQSNLEGAETETKEQPKLKELSVNSTATQSEVSSSNKTDSLLFTDDDFPPL